MSYWKNIEKVWKIFLKMRSVMVCGDDWLEHKPLHSELDIDWKWLYASLSSCWEIQRQRMNKKLGEKWCRKYKAKNEIICSCSHTVTTQKIKYYSHSPTWIFHKTVRPQILQFLPFHFIFPHTDESLACRKTFLFNRNFLLYRNLLFLLSGVTFFY